MRSDEKVPLFIGTLNPAKRERLAGCFSSWQFHLDFPRGIKLHEIPEETGDTHKSNAVEKAKHWSSWASGHAVSSDGGLQIPILNNNWDSVYTHRFAGPDANDQDRIDALLERMSEYSDDERSAYWEESVALGYKGRLIKEWSVKSKLGRIALKPSEIKIHGFWAASIWVFPDIGKSYTELNQKELQKIGDPWVNIKNKIKMWMDNDGWDSTVLRLR
ncbi:MAG: non-canonical purine NTP pyrophosphatase [Dehalococcoidia bacterium]